jgi:hypothetical protein
MQSPPESRASRLKPLQQEPLVLQTDGIVIAAARRDAGDRRNSNL